MTWQSGATASSDAYRDLLASIVNVATSKHVSAVAINAAGSGYIVGDILTYTHASATDDATFRVTSVGGSGDITGLVVQNGGAFGRRVASAAVVAGGSNYSDGDILQLSTGSGKQLAKVSATTTAGAVTSVTPIEGGGQYEGGSDPSAAGATILVGPSTGTGTGCTLTPTMQAITGTTGVSVTGGTGSSATVDLTLTDTGHTTVRDKHDFSHNSINNEKEVVLQGTVSGGDEPYIGFRTWTTTVGVDTFKGILLSGMDDFNAGLAFTSQQNILTASSTPSASTGAYVSLLEAADSWWISITGRKISGVVKNVGGTVTTRQSFYVGHLDVLATATEAPYPLAVFGSQNGTDVAPDSGGIDQTGLTEMFRHSSRTGPGWIRRPSDGSWVQVFNGSGTSFPVSQNTQRGIWPIFESDNAAATDDDRLAVSGGMTFFDNIGRNNGGSPTIQLRPTPDSGTDPAVLFPATIVRSLEGTVEMDVHGELANVFWVSGTKEDGSVIAAEDTFSIGTDRYLVFQCGDRTDRYSFLCMKEGA